MGDHHVIDRTRVGQELDALQVEQQEEMYEGAISPREVSELQVVVEAIRAVLEEAHVVRMSQELTPGLHTVVGNSRLEHALRLLTPGQRDAVERLFTAATAHDADRGTYVSALERNALFNQALMYLQPVLSLALRPDYRDGRALYQDLVTRMNDVRRDILSGILAQGVERPSQTLDIDVTEEDDEDAPPDPLDPDTPQADAPGLLADPDLSAPVNIGTLAAAPDLDAGTEPDTLTEQAPDIDQDPPRKRRDRAP